MRAKTRTLKIVDVTFEYTIGEYRICWIEELDGKIYRTLHYTKNRIVNDSDAFEECLNCYDSVVAKAKQDLAYLMSTRR